MDYIKNIHTILIAESTDNIIFDFEKVLSALDENKNCIVTGFTASQYEELEQSDNAEFKKVEVYVKSGRLIPLAGQWASFDKKISDECFIRNLLYSCNYFYNKFGKKYTTLYTESALPHYAAYSAFSAGFNAVVSGRKMYWLNSPVYSRLLCYPSHSSSTDFSSAAIVPLSSFNGNTKACRISGLDEITSELYESPLDIDVKNTPEAESESETVKALIRAEKLATVSTILNNKLRDNNKITSAWKALLSGDEELAKMLSFEIIHESAAAEGFNFITADADNIKTDIIKFAEDGSGDVVMRLREACGKDTTVAVCADTIDFSVIIDFEANEMKTLRIDENGFAKDTGIME